MDLPYWYWFLIIGFALFLVAGIMLVADNLDSTETDIYWDRDDRVKKKWGVVVGGVLAVIGVIGLTLVFFLG